MKEQSNIARRLLQAASCRDLPLLRAEHTPVIDRNQVLKALAGDPAGVTVAQICQRLLGRTDNVATHRVSAVIAREVARGTICAGAGRKQRRHLTARGQAEAAAAPGADQPTRRKHGISKRSLLLAISRAPGITREALLEAVAVRPCAAAAASMGTLLAILQDKGLVASVGGEAPGLSLTGLRNETAQRWVDESTLVAAVADRQAVDFALRAQADQINVCWRVDAAQVSLARPVPPAAALALIRKAGLQLAPRAQRARAPSYSMSDRIGCSAAPASERPAP